MADALALPSRLALHREFGGERRGSAESVADVTQHLLFGGAVRFASEPRGPLLAYHPSKNFVRHSFTRRGKSAVEELARRVVRTTRAVRRVGRHAVVLPVQVPGAHTYVTAALPPAPPAWRRSTEASGSAWAPRLWRPHESATTVWCPWSTSSVARPASGVSRAFGGGRSSDRASSHLLKMAQILNLSVDE